MPGDIELAACLEAALQLQPKYIDYPDYKTSRDFPRWLSGYRARVRAAFGFKRDEDDKVDEEVRIAISSKLSVGNALDAYDRLDDGDKADYVRLVEKLTKEFIDPYACRKFNEDLKFNKRKKNQTVKEFSQQIKNDMKLYSNLSPTITTAAGEIPNPEWEKQEVVRFRKGMRDIRGKKDSDLRDHLEYHLMEDSDLNWKNALKIATKYEMARWRDVEDENSEGEDSHDACAPIEEEILDNDNGGTEPLARAPKYQQQTTTMTRDSDLLGRVPKYTSKEDVTISSLMEQVLINRSDIQELKANQEQLLAAQEFTNNMLEEVLSKLEYLSCAVQQGSDE